MLHLRTLACGVAAVAVVAALFIRMPPASADAPVITSSGNTVHIHIADPEVRARDTTIPGVKFTPGDTVFVSAGGCVQTGGSGRTWKRYVDPSGDNSDRLYHGLISIPSATAGLVRLQGVMARSPLHVGKAPDGTTAAQMILHIGYEDNDFGDNGYWGHDDGTNDQCRNVGNAYVDITIEHGQLLAPALPQAPMDLWWENTDDNLLPLNPLWGAQVGKDLRPNGTTPDAANLCANFHDEDDALKFGRPACTTQQPTVDEPSFWSDPAFYTVCQTSGGVSGAVHGHINWGLATYTGALLFTDHSKPIPSGTGDDDYDMSLQRSDQASATTGNETFANGRNRALGLEFDSDETIDHFDTPWWSAFHTAVDADDSWSQARAMLGGDGGTSAIVTGVIGIDNKHGAHAELHPVLGMAVQIPARTTNSSESWAFFGRTHGDEGGCSQDQHDFVSSSMMQFLLPVPAMQHPIVTGSSVHGNGAGASWTATALADGTLLTLRFPANASMIWGEITLGHDAASGLYHGTIVKRAAAVLPLRKSERAMAIRAERPGIEPQDAYLDPIFAQLSAGERQRFTAAYLQMGNRISRIGDMPIAKAKSIGVRAPIARLAPILVGSFNVLRRTTPVAPRHTHLARTVPRQLTAATFSIDRKQLAEHQRIANALRATVGVTRARALLRPAEPPRESRPATAQSWWIVRP